MTAALLTRDFTVALQQTSNRPMQVLRSVVAAAGAAWHGAEDIEAAMEAAVGRLPAGARPLVRGDWGADECLLTDAALFPRNAIGSVAITARRREHAFRIADRDSIIRLAAYLQCATSGQFALDELRAAQPALTGYLAGGGCFELSQKIVSRAHAPGIVRLQHAGLVYQSSTTRIAVDPHFHSLYGGEMASCFPAAKLVHDLDAVLISHSHGDHFSPSSLLFVPRDTPIIVPYVPRPSILCPDMAALLAGIGFSDVRTPRWYGDPVTIGDIEVTVLPFYGEQPLASEALPHRDVRNWGNAYHLRTPEYSSVCLIDSGSDPSGSMADVARFVRDQLGPVDYLLSNLGRFGVGNAGPSYITPDGSYFLALSRSQIRRFRSFGGESITLGPEGVAEFCRLCDARIFLPYAHWWDDPYRSSEKDRRLVPQLEACLKAEGSATRVVRWSIGEQISGTERVARTTPLAFLG